MDDCFCDYDPASMYCAETRKARKEHRCYECGRKIVPGEKYEKVIAIWEGDFCACKTCERCLDLREYVKAHVPCFCWAHGNVLDDAHNTVDHYAHEAPGLLFGYWRRVVKINNGGRVTTK